MTATLDLPEDAARLLARVDSGQVLGASRQLHVLGDCITVLATALEGDPVVLAAQVRGLVEHVHRTRGASSQAVSNGIALMTRAVFAERGSEPHGELAAELMASVDAFTSHLSTWQESLRDNAAALLVDCRTVLAYDYSSSVSQALEQLAACGVQLRVFVPEARSLDGGRKFLGDWDEKIVVDLVPDAAMGWALGMCDAALAGAETLSAEGGCYNTIGTAVAAHEAARRNVPFYVLSILLKTDLNTLGGERPSPSLDFLTIRNGGVDNRHAIVRGQFPDLDYTEPEVITSVITERGALAPSDVAAETRVMLGQREDDDG